MPPGVYSFSQGKFLFTTSAQRPVSGTLTLTRGGFYGGTISEVSWRGRVEFRPRFQVEPTVSLNHFKTPWGDGRNTTGPGFPLLDNRSFVVKITKLFRSW